MYDVKISKNYSYQESKIYQSGKSAKLTKLKVKGKYYNVGMTICYDLRFPQLYRALAKAGAGIIMVPSAFTFPSGRAHWHVLLRARAIETGSFVVAPAQCGTHADSGRTYGHALIVSPWGDILAEAPTDDANAEAGANDGFVIADIDITRVEKARNAIPSLGSDASFE